MCLVIAKGNSIWRPSSKALIRKLYDSSAIEVTAMENGEERNVQKSLLDEAGHKLEVKAYKRRWIILGIFMIYEAINAFQWVEYSIITHIVMKYYNVSSVTVDWTAILYMVVYPPLVIPASYIIDKMVREVTLLWSISRS